MINASFVKNGQKNATGLPRGVSHLLLLRTERYACELSLEKLLSSNGFS
jgi:hypothetical protein